MKLRKIPPTYRVPAVFATAELRERFRAWPGLGQRPQLCINLFVLLFLELEKAGLSAKFKLKRQIQNNALRNKSWHDRSAGPSGALRTYRHPVARVTTDDPRHDHCFSHSRTRSKFLNLCDATCDPSLPADSPDVKPDRVKVGKLGNWGATHALHVLTSQLHQMALARSLSVSLSLGGPD